MGGLPAPEDLAVRVLVWLGAPALIIAIFTSVLAFFGWISAAKSSVRNVSLTVTRARQVFTYWTSERQRAAVTLVLASTLFTAIAYSLTQLMGVTYQNFGHGGSIAEGMKFGSSYLTSHLLGYEHWTPLSAWTVVGALVSIFLLNVANLIGASRLRSAVMAPWGLTLGLGVIAGALIGFAGFCVLILGLMHADNYQSSMAILYLLWVICLLSLPWLAIKIVSASERVLHFQ
jgi:hypothetical protein